VKCVETELIQKWIVKKKVELDRLAGEEVTRCTFCWKGFQQRNQMCYKGDCGYAIGTKRYYSSPMGCIVILCTNRAIAIWRVIPSGFVQNTHAPRGIVTLNSN